jgi:hypothetical protein
MKSKLGLLMLGLVLYPPVIVGVFYCGWQMSAVETEIRCVREQREFVKRLRKGWLPENHQPFTYQFNWISACTNCASWWIESKKVICDPSNHETRR